MKHPKPDSVVIAKVTTRNIFTFRIIELIRAAKKGMFYVGDRVNVKDGVTHLLAYRPPYGWDAILAFLAFRAIPGVETVGHGTYRRTVAVVNDGHESHGWISVSHIERENSLAVTLALSLRQATPHVLSWIRNLFDIDCDPVAVYETLSVMNDLKSGICVAGTRRPGCFSPFEMAVRAILGQQITVKAARTLAGRFAVTFGEAVETPFEDLTHTFPTPERIEGLIGPIESHLGPLGIIRTRARSIAALANAMTKGEISLSPLADPETEMQKLLSLPGFGPWTVQYLAIRALGLPDAFPHTDHGVKKALPGFSAREILALSEKWRPWRSYATISLWNSL